MTNTAKTKSVMGAAIFALAAILCVSLFSKTDSVTADANSAQTYWEGSSGSYGLFVADEDCPVTVLSEKLTLSIPDFPSTYESLKDMEAYSAKVTAEYTFYNPASYDVKMTLAFPFGTIPDYLYYYDESQNTYKYYDDTARYAITADGEEVERTMRYTANCGTFDAESYVARLSDEKRTSGILSESTFVTVYTYTIDTKNNGYDELYVAANFAGTGVAAKTRVLLEKYNGYNAEQERYGLWARGGSELKMYVIGEDLNELPEWKFYENASCKTLVEGGSMTLASKTTATFGELAMTYYDGESGVSEVDWFNAAVDALDYYDSYYDSGAIVYPLTLSDLSFSGDDLMRWYEYEVTIGAGETLVNAVTAPIYPNFDYGYEPPVYYYTYYLSPARCWAEFGALEITIETPYYIANCSVEMEETDGGYVASLSGLPDGELTFRLSSGEDPYIPFNSTSFWLCVFIAVCVFGPPILLIAAIITIVLIVRRRKKKKNSAQAPENDTEDPGLETPQ